MKFILQIRMQRRDVTKTLSTIKFATLLVYKLWQYAAYVLAILWTVLHCSNVFLSRRKMVTSRRTSVESVHINRVLPLCLFREQVKRSVSFLSVRRFIWYRLVSISCICGRGRRRGPSSCYWSWFHRYKDQSYRWPRIEGNSQFQSRNWKRPLFRFQPASKLMGK